MPPITRGHFRASPVHSWRHTAGAILRHEFKNVKQIQERLGHSDPQITAALYIASLPEADTEAATALGSLIPKRLAEVFEQEDRPKWIN